MSDPGDKITLANSARPERKLHVAIYFHANNDELRARVNDIVYAIESGLGEAEDVAKFTYVEAIITDTETIKPNFA